MINGKEKKVEKHIKRKSNQKFLYRMSFWFFRQGNSISKA